MRSREPREKDGSAQNSNLRFDFRRKTVISGSASGPRQSFPGGFRFFPDFPVNMSFPVFFPAGNRAGLEHELNLVFWSRIRTTSPRDPIGLSVSSAKRRKACHHVVSTEACDGDVLSSVLFTPRICNPLVALTTNTAGPMAWRSRVILLGALLPGAAAAMNWFTVVSGSCLR